MKIRNCIFAFFGKTAAATVGLCLLFYVIMEILASTSLELERGIPFGQFLLLLLSASFLSAASYLFRLPLPKQICFLLHYITCFLLLFVTFLLAGKFDLSGASRVLVFLAIFSLFYGIFWGILLLFRFLLFPEKRREKTKKEEKKEAEYVKRF